MDTLACRRTDHAGEDYLRVLEKLHEELSPQIYLEIGTLEGRTLAAAKCTSVAIDPSFQLKFDVIKNKKICLFYQMESDEFFKTVDVNRVLGNRIDLAFLDGMHRCEFLLRDFMNTERLCHAKSLITMHDCLPLDVSMTTREQNAAPPLMPHRRGWWTGDVWRTLAALKQFRPDLKIICLDAQATGLVLVSRLNSESRELFSRYDEIVSWMMRLDLNQLSIDKFFQSMGVESTSVYMQPGKLKQIVA